MPEPQLPRNTSTEDALQMDESKIHKPCPEADCNGELRVKTNSHNGTKFLGCDRYPACRHTEEIPEYLRMIATGAPTLFDL